MNTISINQNDESAFEVLWNGPVGINYAGNTVTMLGNNQIGLNLHALSTSDQLSGTISNNALTMSGNNRIGYRIEADDTSSLLVTQNGVTMNGGFGTGFWFDFADATDSFIHTNGVIDNGGSGTGMGFNAVAANSRLQIDNNFMNFASQQPGGRPGDRVQQRRGDDSALQHDEQHDHRGDERDHHAGAGQATGSIIINGAAVAAPESGIVIAPPGPGASWWGDARGSHSRPPERPSRREMAEGVPVQDDSVRHASHQNARLPCLRSMGEEVLNAGPTRGRRLCPTVPHVSVSGGKGVRPLDPSGRCTWV